MLDAAAAAVDPDEVLAYARALIAAKSENPGGTEDEAAAVAADILTGLGATPEIVRSEAGRPSVVASIGTERGPSLAWNGHLDVVPAGSLDTWRHDPWAGDIDDDGRLVGRGAADMKGPIAAALAAASALRRAGTPLAGSLVFHLAADEELAGVHGTRVLWERGLLDPGRRDRGRAERAAGRARRARRRMVHGHRLRQGRPRLAAAPRRERDHVDGAVPAAAARGAPRHRAPARAVARR